MPDEQQKPGEERTDQPEPEDQEHGGQAEAEPEAEADDDDEAGFDDASDLEDAPQGGGPQEVAGRGAQQRRDNDGFRSLRERAQRAERELQAERAERQRVEREREQRNAAAEEDRFLESIAHLTPLEQSREISRRSETRVGNQLAMLRFEQQNHSDRAEFKAMARTDPVYQRHADRVEEIHAEHMAKGQFVPREVVLKLVLGEEALARRARAAPAQRKRAEAATARETVRRGGGARSDQASERGRGATATARERLEKQDVRF